MKTIKFTLAKTLDELEITRNKLAVEAKVRPNTISDLVNQNAKSINLKTLESILNALEQIAKDNNIDRDFAVDDVFIYTD